MKQHGSGEVYWYRTRKPHLALLFKTHVGYVGKTRNPIMRNREHLTGYGRYGYKEPQPWSDLRPVRHAIRFRNIPDWALSLAEFLMIKFMMPVYNDRMNRGNPRRIPIWKARIQRKNRDGGTPVHWSIRPSHVLVPALIALTLVVVL